MRKKERRTEWRGRGIDLGGGGVVEIIIECEA